jgi:hypothetical protein
MGKVEHIQRQVESLTPEEQASFRLWYISFDADEWDRQIERDVAAGKLDALAERALEEHRQGKTRPLKPTCGTPVGASAPVGSAA